MAEKVYIQDDIFIESADGLALLGTQCKSCGNTFFPKVEYCPKCPDVNLEEIPLSRKGTLYTFTTTYMPSMHFDAPFSVGYVSIDDGPLVFGPLEKIDNKPFKIGMEMEIRMESLWTEEDKEIVGYKFYPL